jgi:hypothetical protein
MKPSKRIFTLFILIAMLAVSLGVTARPAVAAGPYVCIPSCSEVDGRMLSLASVGYETLAGTTISIKISVPATMPSFEIGIFDGDTSGTWDFGSTALVYTLYADPTNTGDTSIQLAQWTGSSMTDNGWSDLTITQDSQAQAPSLDYFYHMHVELPYAAVIQTWSSFKIRSSAPVELAANESFAYSVPLFTNLESNIIYPSGLPTTYPLDVPTTFDGTWKMFFYVPTSTPSFVIWDGDMDYGTFDCSIRDTDDPNTPNDAIPSWATGISDLTEGVAISTNKCRNSAGQIIIGPEGEVFATGNPADDVLGIVLRRSPSVTYDVIDPNGNVYHNANPSGNREWEQFSIGLDPNSDYPVAELLPAGIYQIQITGLDLRNLNAWHVTYDRVCIHEDGTPCIPVLHSYLIGDTVWYDANGNAVQDAGEAGISGVTVTLLDSNGIPVPGGTAATDVNGQYTFEVDAGTYSVQVDASNYTGALAGFVATTSEVKTYTVTIANVLDYDFGYRQPASIGDFVWNDLNGNGLQDAGEPGIPNVTVQLLGSDGTTVLGTTTTDGSGNYSFTNLFAGTYTVQFTASAGFTFTTKNAGSDATIDSNANLTGMTDAITLAAGATDNTIDAGLKLAQTVNYCGYIRTPGFWKNYDNHMTSATFKTLLENTQDFKALSVKDAVTILSTNNGKSKISGYGDIYKNVDARFLKFLLTAEINAVWNGQDNAAALGGVLDTGNYQGTGTVNQLLSQAYATLTSTKTLSSTQGAYVVYLGGDGEGASAGACLVQP